MLAVSESHDNYQQNEAMLLLYSNRGVSASYIFSHMAHKLKTIMALTKYMAHDEMGGIQGL